MECIYCEAILGLYHYVPCIHIGMKYEKELLCQLCQLSVESVALSTILACNVGVENTVNEYFRF